MDKLENEREARGESSTTSKTHKQSPDNDSQEIIQKNRVARPQSQKRWERLTAWLVTSTGSPEWLPSPWKHPITGFVGALLLPFVSILVALLFKQIFLSFVFPGVLLMLSILVVAFFWGAGPGILATLWGTFLFNLSILSPQFALSFNSLQDVFETCFLLILGIFMSLAMSRIERVRAEAVAAHLEIERLMTQLETEKEALGEAQQLAVERASEIEAVFEAIADGIFVYDAQGHLLRTNAAAQTFNPLLGQSEYLARSYSERVLPFSISDEHKQLLEYADQPLMRILRGERVTGSLQADTVLLQQKGTDFLMNISGAPILDDEGHIRGAVIATRDVTERRKLELRTHEALDALLSMTQLIGYRLANKNDNPNEPSQWTEQTMREIARRVAELTRDFLGCQRLSISIVEPDSGIMRAIAVVGLSQDQEQQWWVEQQQQETRFIDSPEQSLVQRLLAKEVVLFDMTQAPWNTYPNPYGIRTMLIAPMNASDNLIGLLTLDYGGVDHQYTTEELELAGAAAKLVGTFIEREQLLRKQTELLASNQQMAELIALAHDAIIVRTPDSTITFWNKGAERLYGWTEQEACGQISHELLQTSFPYSREITDNLLMLHKQWEGQLIHSCRDGKRVIVESRHVLLQDKLGQPTAILEINRDITERDRMQREREEARANELALREANRRMDEFLGVVSHELRTPLTTIKGNVQLAKFRLRSGLREIPANMHVLKNMLEEIQMMLDRAERQTNVQNRMVSDLLDISRLQADKLELRLVPCDLTEIVEELVEDQRSTVQKRAIDLEMDEGENVQVSADPERIGQVLSNFLTNALKYSQESRPVIVRLWKDENKAHVSVQDEGPGLTPLEQERIWDRFYQVEEIKRQRGSSVGLGLGLYISRAIVEQHQGEVGVESTKGKGSTFWFAIPLQGHGDHEAV